MTTASMTVVLDAVLQDEGGLADVAGDRGGLTNYGLTRPFLETVTGRPWSDADIRALTPTTARGVYALWMRMRRLDQLPDHFLLAWVVVDYAVIAGDRRAIRAVQKHLGLAQDGIAGAETQGTWHQLSDVECRVAAAAVIADRAMHHGRDITTNPTQAKFAHGWMVRLAKQIRACAA